MFDARRRQAVGDHAPRVTGAAEDPNRLVEYRGSSYDADGRADADPVSGRRDRPRPRSPPPVAELSLGLTCTRRARSSSVRATVYNALVAHAYQPDVFFDYEPHLEYLPNPYEGFRAYLSAMYQY